MAVGMSSWKRTDQQSGHHSNKDSNRPHLAVGGADAGSWDSMEQVDSPSVLLLSWGPNGHICQLVPIHIPQHRHGCSKAAPGVALLPAENMLASPPSPLLNEISVKTVARQPMHRQPSPTQTQSRQQLTPLGMRHTDTWPPRVSS